MKTRREPVGKSKGNSSARETAMAANHDFPRQQMIAEAAYFHAERRGFAPGNEMSDWLQAEAQVAGLRGAGQ